MKKLIKWAVIIAVVGLLCVVYSKYLSFEYIKQDRERLLLLVTRYPISSICLYIVLAAVAIGVGLPVIAPISLLGGFLFGTALGTLYATIGATLGVFVLFCVFQYLIAYTEFNLSGSWYGKQLSQFSNQLRHHGHSYLLTMHWMTVIPFSLIAAVAAAVDVPPAVVVWTTIVGSVPMIFIYALAGRELGTIESPTDIFSWKVMISFGLLALLALIPILIQRIKKPKNR